MALLSSSSRIDTNNIIRSSSSNKVIIIIVYVSLFLDNILLTVVVPIIPDYLYNLEHNDSVGGWTRNKNCSEVCLQFDNDENVADKELEDHNNNNNNSLFGSTFYAVCICNKSSVTEIRNNKSNDTPDDIINENAKVGLLFSSKAFVQLITNSFMGAIINRLGYVLPLFFGNFSIMISSTVFAYSSSYGVLFLARSLQGIGSSCIAVSGLGMIADRYPDDEARSKVMGVALGGIAMGVLVGYPFGGILYDFVGKMTPFLIISSASLLNGVFQLCVLDFNPGTEKYSVEISQCNVLKDPYVLIIAGTIWVSTSAMAVLEPCLPIWLMETIAPEKWQLGTVFIPDSIGYLIGTSFFGVVALKLGRWLVTGISLLVVGMAAMLVTTATEMMQLIVPHFLLGFGIGVTDSALMPLLAYIFDAKYNAKYGTVYAIAQAAVSLAYFVGPLLGSQVVKQIGFPWLMKTVGILNMVYSPLCLFLRKITIPAESQIIILNSTLTRNYTIDYPQRSYDNSKCDHYQRFHDDAIDSD